MKWIEALRKWNAGKATWCIPRKGSKDHAEVKALMGKAPEPPAKAKTPEPPAKAKTPAPPAKAKTPAPPAKAKTPAPQPQVKINNLNEFMTSDEVDDELATLRDNFRRKGDKDTTYLKRKWNDIIAMGKDKGFTPNEMMKWLTEEESFHTGTYNNIFIVLENAPEPAPKAEPPSTKDLSQALFFEKELLIYDKKIKDLLRESPNNTKKFGKLDKERVAIERALEALHIKLKFRQRGIDIINERDLKALIRESGCFKDFPNLDNMTKDEIANKLMSFREGIFKKCHQLHPLFNLMSKFGTQASSSGEIKERLLYGIRRCYKIIENLKTYYTEERWKNTKAGERKDLMRDIDHLKHCEEDVFRRKLFEFDVPRDLAPHLKKAYAKWVDGTKADKLDI